MARPLFWLGIPTTTTAVVVARSTANGTVTVTCNNGTFTEPADTTVRDGLVKVTITGLNPDTKYAYTVSTPDGDSGSATLKTFPAEGPVKIIYYSCAHPNRDSALAVLQAQDPHCIVCLGDIRYFATADVFGSFTSVSMTGGSTDVADYRAAYRVSHAFPMFRNMAENIPFGTVSDDHEFDINNVTWADVSASTGIIDAHAEGNEDYALGNPASPYATDDTAPFYFSFECGNTEVFVLSMCIHGRDATDAQHMMRDTEAEGNGCIGRNGGTNQEDWLLAGLAASSKKYKLVLSPKMTLTATNVNGDSWSSYSTEMNRVLQAIHDSGVNGVMFGCGDWHSPSIHRSTLGVDGSTYDHVAVTPCNFDGDLRDAGAASVYTVYHYEGTDNYDGDWFYCGIHGLVETSEAEIKTSIVNQVRQTLAWATVLPTANSLADSSQSAASKGFAI